MESLPIQHIRRYQSFLSQLVLNPALAQTKTVEVDLTGTLNPTNLLNRLFFEQEQWLGFEDFLQHYLAENKVLLQRTFAHIAWPALETGLRARLYRTQFGFLTEYHAFFACRCFFPAVYRDKGLDKAGVDFQLFYQQQTYNVHIFVDTPRAWAYRNYKSANKSGNKLPGVHVNLPYSLAANRFNSLRFLPNGFGIYTSGYLKYLKQELDLGRIKSGADGGPNITGTTGQGFVYSPP